MEKSPIGVYNFLFDDKRTGNDVFSFRIANPQDIQSTQVWSEFRPKGKFGHVRKDEKDSFRLFAPRAERVDLLLYGDSQKQEEEKRVAMHRDEEGSWTYEGLVREKYYRFSVFHKTMDKESGTLEKKILDPYAKATVGRNGPGLIITPQTLETRKSHWTPPPMKDLVILEALRDLGPAPVDLSAEERLGFRGLTKWLQSESCYVRQLGVNAVELQPILEFDARTKRISLATCRLIFLSGIQLPSCPRSGSVVRNFKGGNRVPRCWNRGNPGRVYNRVGIPAHLLNLDRSLYFRTDEFGRRKTTVDAATTLDARRNRCANLFWTAWLTLFRPSTSTDFDSIWEN